MQPIRAKFPGVCARTGKRYQAGDLIVKLANGNWALAQDKTGAVKVAPEWRLALLPDGTEQQIPLHVPTYCRACILDAGIDPTSKPSPDVIAPYVMERQGDAISCPRCNRTIQIISQAELDRRKAEQEAQWEAARAADREANLHLEHAGYGFYQLSHRLDPEQWKLVSHLFRYWSADDMDEMDYFDIRHGGYFVAGGPAPEGVILNGAPPSSLSNVEDVERILKIKPQNTVVEREKQAKILRAAAAQAKAERLAFLERLRDAFPREEGEHLWGEEKLEEEGWERTTDRLGNPQYRKQQPDGQYTYISGGPASAWSGRAPLRLEGETIPVGEGQNIYGGGEWYVLDADGAHVWHVRNNGMDGDDWSRNNIRTGGAGAIGLRYPLTEERRAVLNELRGRLPNTLLEERR